MSRKLFVMSMISKVAVPQVGRLVRNSYKANNARTLDGGTEVLVLCDVPYPRDRRRCARRVSAQSQSPILLQYIISKLELTDLNQ